MQNALGVKTVRTIEVEQVEYILTLTHEQIEMLLRWGKVADTATDLLTDEENELFQELEDLRDSSVYDD